MEEGRKSPPTNILPPGEKPIRLVSEECEEKFHVTSTTDLPLLDVTSAKRREVLSHFQEGSPGSPRPQVLPPGDTTIPLPSVAVETQFHVTSTTTAPLLHD